MRAGKGAWKCAWLAVAWLALGGVAVAQAFRDGEGRASPPSESRRYIDGFSGMLLVTPDMDWAAKWDTPPDVIPHFREASEVARGEKLAILVFLANPLLVDGRIDTVVDVRVTQPGGQVRVDAPGEACVSGPYGGAPGNVLLCGTSLLYVADADDLSGDWTVEVVLKDRHRGIEMPLRTAFRVLD